MNLLQGNIRISVFLLYVMAYLGVGVGILAHFFTWRIITGSPKELVFNGLEGLGVIGIAILVIYGVLLFFKSSYSIIFAFVFFAYMLEQVIGTNLLRYMPLEVTKLMPALYLSIPLAAVLVLVGSFAPILSQILKEKMKD